MTNNTNNNKIRVLNDSTSQMLGSEVCQDPKCNIIHNDNQGVTCDVVAKWKRINNYSLMIKNSPHVIDNFSSSINLEVISKIIINKLTSNHLLRSENLQILGALGIYAFK